MSKRIFRYAGFLFSTFFFILALTVLYHELRQFQIQDSIDQLKHISGIIVFLAVILTILNYLLMTGYDYLALRFVNYFIPYRKIANVSLISYAFSNNMGVFMFGGAPVRYRLYSASGLSGIDISNIVIFCSISIGIGFLALGGIVFLVEPLSIPDIFHFPGIPVRMVGVIFLSLVSLYLVANAVRKKPFKFGKWEFPLIPVRLSLLQIALATADWALAGFILYLLFPYSAGLSYLNFLGIFLLAQFIGLASTVPGGLGVFETAMLLMLSPGVPPASIVTALLLFRGIFYILPFAISIIALVVGEIIRRRVSAKNAMQYLGTWISSLTPYALSFITFAGGIILLFSAATPGIRDRLGLLIDFVPLPVQELSHFLSSLAGVSLIILARGLQRRLDGAYILTVVLLSGGAIFSLLKGFDYEEAIILTTMLIVMLNSRHYFYRKSSLLDLRLTPGWITAIFMTMTASLWLGMFAYRHIEYANDLWWQFTFSGDAPRSLRAMVGTFSVIFFFVLFVLLSPALKKPQPATKEELEEAKPIIDRGPGTNGYLALLDDKALLFNKHRNAFIMYGIEKKTWITMGDPIGPSSEHKDLIWRFREMSDQYDGRPAFYQINEDNIPIYADLGLTLLKLGEEGIVSLKEFTIPDGKKDELRRVLHKFEKLQYTFEIVPQTQIPLLIKEFKTVSDAWLSRKHTREKGFSLGFFKEDYLSLFPAAVIRQGNKIIAFANILSTSEKQELSIDLMRYYPNAPNGTMDFLLTRLMLWGKEEGFQRFNLGMAPLSGVGDNQMVPFVTRFESFLYRHSDHFYNFQGLRDYKDKFGPHWEPRYLASPGGFSLPLVITDIAAIISRGFKGVISR